MVWEIKLDRWKEEISELIEGGISWVYWNNGEFADFYNLSGSGQLQNSTFRSFLPSGMLDMWLFMLV